MMRAPQSDDLGLAAFAPALGPARRSRSGYLQGIWGKALLTELPGQTHRLLRYHCKMGRNKAAVRRPVSRFRNSLTVCRESSVIAGLDPAIHHFAKCVLRRDGPAGQARG